uniref:Uncharacterized protein n=1 Tax=Tanacetum cinerariifolium TaxID=118510 RepID=A0A6L2NIA4_TANCI|nr:hypothetical protein [Tanacetum cinerariifolium]
MCLRESLSFGTVRVKEKNGVAPSAKEKNEAVRDGVAPCVMVASGNNAGTQEANSIKVGRDNLHDENARETPRNFTAKRNKEYGFFLEKRVAYPVVANYDECPKNLGWDVAKKSKIPSQAPRDVPKDVESTKEVSNPTIFDVLNRVENDVDFGTNGKTSNVASKEANSSGSLFWDMRSSRISTTHLSSDLGTNIIDKKFKLVDDKGKPLIKVDYSGNHDSEDEVASVENDMANFLALKKYSKPENPNELFQKLLEDLKELAEYENSPSKDRLIFLNDNEEHSVQNEESFENPSNEIAVSSSNQEKEEPPQDSDIRQLIKECSTEVSEEQKQSMEDTMLELVKICQKKVLCIHDNVEYLIESALITKLLSINSQHLEKEQQEVKEVVEQPAERGNRSIESLQNFRVIHKSSISLNNTSQISSIHAVAPILSTKEPEYSPSMRYENSYTTLETESDEIIKSGVEELIPILSENEVTSEDKRECDVLVCEDSSASDVCDDHSEIFSNFKDDDDISSDDDDFEDVEYVEASLPDPKIVSGVEDENVVHQAEENDVNQEEEEDDLEDISQIQDIVLREKLLSITRLIANIESLNDNPTPDCVFNSFKSDNSLSDNFSPEFKTFCDHTEETRSDNTNTHANDSLPEYDSFCFEIKPDQERLINVVKNDIPDDSSNDPLLEEANLFLASDNSIPPGIENVANDSEGDVRFLEELLIDDSILSHESSDFNFEDNPSVPLPHPEPPDEEFDFGDEISIVIDKLECIDAKVQNDNYFSFMFAKVFSFLSTESEDTILDPVSPLRTSEESVGTSTTRVILFGTIPTTISATVPIVDPPVVHDDTPLIPTETL